MIVYDHNVNLDEAIVGVVQVKGLEPRVCYSFKKCVDIVVRDNDCTYEEALEWLTCNTLEAFVGEHTPAFLLAGDREFVDEWAARYHDEEEGAVVSSSTVKEDQP